MLRSDYNALVTLIIFTLFFLDCHLCSSTLMRTVAQNHVVKLVCTVANEARRALTLAATLSTLYCTQQQHQHYGFVSTLVLGVFSTTIGSFLMLIAERTVWHPVVCRFSAWETIKVPLVSCMGYLLYNMQWYSASVVNGSGILSGVQWWNMLGDSGIGKCVMGGSTIGNRVSSVSLLLGNHLDELAIVIFMLSAKLYQFKGKP